MITYLSTLSTPTTGKWTNQAIVFASGHGDGTKPFFQGANWTTFASQNPTVLPGTSTNPLARNV